MVNHWHSAQPCVSLPLNPDGQPAQDRSALPDILYAGGKLLQLTLGRCGLASGHRSVHPCRELVACKLRRAPMNKLSLGECYPSCGLLH